MNTTTSKSHVITQILLAAVAIVLGYLLLFNTDIQVITLCQILCGGLIIAGVVAISSYFIAGDFRRIDRYGFSIGILLILSGIIGLIRTGDLTANFEMYSGALSLVLGVLILQATVQIKVLDYAAWVLTLILTVACLAGAFCVLAGFTMITNLVPGFSSWLLLICGCTCLFCMIVTWICILLAGRREKKLEKEKEAQAAAYAAAQTEAQAAAQAQVQSQAQSARDEILQGEYHQIAAPPSGSYQPSGGQAPAGQPAEIHHTGFDAADTSSSLPPAEDPQLVFEPSEGHHTDFDPSNQ